LVDRERIVDGHAVKAGDVLVGLPSSGLHSNGFSLVRYVVFDQHGLDVDTYVPELGRTVGEELLVPTTIYVDAAVRARKTIPVAGMAHITGGGLLGNIPRIIPYGLHAQLDLRNWQIPAVFAWMTRLGNLDETECYQTFNMGIGFVLIVPQESADNLCGELAHDGARVIGMVVPGDAGVGAAPMTRIAILASGNGTDCEAVLEAVEQGRIHDAVVAVVVADRRRVC